MTFFKSHDPMTRVIRRFGGIVTIVGLCLSLATFLTHDWSTIPTHLQSFILAASLFLLCMGAIILVASIGLDRMKSEGQ